MGISFSLRETHTGRGWPPAHLAPWALLSAALPPSGLLALGFEPRVERMEGGRGVPGTASVADYSHLIMPEGCTVFCQLGGTHYASQGPRARGHARELLQNSNLQSQE